MTQRKRWLKTREFEKGECVAVRRPGKADTDRNAKRPPFVCVLVWVYFVHERFESGFRDLTLCVKVLRSCLEHIGAMVWLGHVSSAGNGAVASPRALARNS